MGVPSVSSPWKDVKAKAQLPDPAQSLVVKCLKNTGFNAVERNMTVDVVVDDFLEALTHQ